MEDQVKNLENQTQTKQAETVNTAATTPAAKPGAEGKQERGNRRGGGRRREPQSTIDEQGIDSRVLVARRISRMYHGGRRMRFSSFVVAGDREGKVGIGSGKGQDVAVSQKKATEKAKAGLFNVAIQGNTIPHTVEFKYKSSIVLLKPAAPGTGIIAGATVKAVAELAGIKDLLTKVHGSRNTINTAYATIGALKSLRKQRL